MKTFLTRLVILLLFLKFGTTHAQLNGYRYFPQTPVPTGLFYVRCLFHDIVPLGDGGYVVSYYPYCPTLTSPYPEDQFTIKLDANFNPIWFRKKFGACMKISNTSFMMAGENYVEKLTNSGSSIWCKKSDFYNYNFSAIFHKNKVRTFGDINHMVTKSIDTLGNISPNTLSSVYLTYSEYVNLTSVNELLVTHFNSQITKLDTNANPVWVKRYTNNSGYFQLHRAVERSVNSYALLGEYTNTVGVSYRSIAVLKTDSSGNCYDAKIIKGNAPLGYRLGGYCKMNNNDLLLTFISGWIFKGDSLWICRIDSNANVKWTKLVGKGIGIGNPYQANSNKYVFPFYGDIAGLGFCDSTGNSGCITYSQNFVSSAVTVTTNVDNISFQTNQNIQTNIVSVGVLPQLFWDSCFTFPLNQDIKNIEALDFKVFPNPASQQIQIYSPLFTETDHLKLTLTNALGQVVREEDIPLKNQQVVLNTADLPDGVYSVQGRLEGKGNFVKRVLIQH